MRIAVDNEDQRQPDEGTTFNPIIVVSLLLASLFLNIFLARKISRLNAAIEAMKSEERLQVGTRVPPLEGHSVEGTPQRLDYGDVKVPTVLYVFTPQCVWCARNIHNFRALIASSGPRYRIVGISLSKDNLKQYLERENLALTVFTDLPESARINYRFGGTPTTIVVSPEGKVLRVWMGAYSDPNRDEIERYLGVQLPGCCSAGAPP